MSATRAARKRGKPASGAGAGAEAFKRRRKGDSSGDKVKSKGGGKMNEEISSDSESERVSVWGGPPVPMGDLLNLPGS